MSRSKPKSTVFFCEEIKIAVTQEISGGSVTQGINNGDKRPLSTYSCSHLVIYHSHLVFPSPRCKRPNETPGTGKLIPTRIFQILWVVTDRPRHLRYLGQYPSVHLGTEALADKRYRENCAEQHMGVPVAGREPRLKECEEAKEQC